MAATIKDIARKLNISVSTVSYAINGGPRPVPDEVKRRVLEVARELNYRPNRLARSLITRRSHTIGVLPDLVTHDIVLSQFVQYVLNGIFNESGRAGYDSLFFTACDHENPGRTVDQVLDGRVDGLIFLATEDQSELMHELDRQEFPYVLVSTANAGAGMRVGVDNESGVRQALHHLHALGHRRIAHLAGRQHMIDARQRLDGFTKAMGELGLEVRQDWIRDGDFVTYVAQRVASEWLSQSLRPTAIFCANDEMAVGAIQAARELGLRVPHDLSIVGFDDIPLSATYSVPLTTLRQPMTEMGSAACRMLIDRLDGRSPVTDVRFQPALIVRQSTGPTEDSLI